MADETTDWTGWIIGTIMTALGGSWFIIAGLSKVIRSMYESQIAAQGVRIGVLEKEFLEYKLFADNSRRDIEIKADHTTADIQAKFEECDKEKQALAVRIARLEVVHPI